MVEVPCLGVEVHALWVVVPCLWEVVHVLLVVLCREFLEVEARDLKTVVDWIRTE